MHIHIDLVRHVETVSNREGLFGDGLLDDVLSPLGEGQCEALGDRYESESVIFDKVFSGGQKRQELTLEAIMGSRHRGLGRNVDERLREKSVGSWSGKSKTDIPPEDLEAWRKGKLLPEGGESSEDFARRVRAFFDNNLLLSAKLLLETKGENPETHEAGRMLVVTSGNPVRIIVGACLGLQPEQMSRLDCDNGSVSRLRVVKDGRVFVELANDTHHLAGVGFKRLPGTF